MRSAWVNHKLFGSAIECQMPSTWKPVTYATLPDGGVDDTAENSCVEKWQDPSSGVFLTASIQRMQIQQDENHVMALFFEEIGKSWLEMEAESRNFSSVKNYAGVMPPNLPPQSNIAFAKGSFPVQSETIGSLVTLHVEVCIIRLPATETDLLVALSTPSVVRGEESAWEKDVISDRLSRFIESFEVKDCNLLSWQDHVTKRTDTHIEL